MAKIKTFTIKSNKVKKSKSTKIKTKPPKLTALELRVKQC